MGSVLGIIGMIINGLGFLGIAGGIIALLAGNSDRGKELLFNGLIAVAIGIALFTIAAFIQRDKKETNKSSGSNDQ